MEQTHEPVFNGTPMDVDHALMGLQIRINTAKHIESLEEVLKSAEFKQRLDRIKDMRTEYCIKATIEGGKALQKYCMETRWMLH